MLNAEFKFYFLSHAPKNDKCGGKNSCFMINEHVKMPRKSILMHYDNEDDKIEVVVEARLILRLLVNLTNAKTITNITKYYTNTVCLVSYHFQFYS